MADRVRVSMATRGLILDNKCGRPSESIISMEDCSILGRPGSPVVAELQPASKKGRTFEDSMEVVNKRQRNLTNACTPGGSNGVNNGGSRYAVLSDEGGMTTERDVGESREVQTDNNLGAASLRHRREESSLALAKE
ncbi:hypothetical protein V6N11_032965 [Hibiscus sabdariffa]|uniref:Uncharacterized protein n=2 Tax=Hibiscus sabdariffa TaxID=183260 RepID=A0ABR1ZED8_9ROSI